MSFRDRPCPLLFSGFSSLHAEATVIMHQFVHAVSLLQCCNPVCPFNCGTTCMSRVVTHQAQAAAMVAHILSQAALEQP